MFSHVMIGSDDIATSKKFYDALFNALGHGPGLMDDKGRCFYITDTGILAITKPINGEPATYANGGTIGFSARNVDMVDSWHEAGVNNGGSSCEDPPGERTSQTGRFYVAYLRDPYGNKLCALYQLA